MTNDILIRGVANNGQIRFLAANTTQCVEEARRRHDTLPTATAALGRLLTAGVLMGALLKGEEKVSIQVMGDGPLGRLMVDADSQGHVRGYVSNPQVHLPLNAQNKLDVGGAVGQGTLMVIKDFGLKEPYRGTVPLISGELGDDIAYYFTQSEQTPSAVALGVLVERDHSVRAAGGLLVQLLPGADDTTAAILTERLQGLPAITTLIDSGKTPREIVHMLLGDLQPEILATNQVHFQCSCSRERLEKVLVAMGREELEGLLETQGEAEAICQFCREVYRFSGSELKRLLWHISPENGSK
ncbi:MAG: Hsp33 family molecular chaperone HslO [Limnochordia bacterium]|jgi:molecular chaperone Hsp33